MASLYATVWAWPQDPWPQHFYCFHCIPKKLPQRFLLLMNERPTMLSSNTSGHIKTHLASAEPHLFTICLSLVQSTGATYHKTTLRLWLMNLYLHLLSSPCHRSGSAMSLIRDRIRQKSAALIWSLWMWGMLLVGELPVRLYTPQRSGESLKKTKLTDKQKLFHIDPVWMASWQKPILTDASRGP